MPQHDLMLLGVAFGSSDPYILDHPTRTMARSRPVIGPSAISPRHQEP